MVAVSAEDASVVYGVGAASCCGDDVVWFGTVGSSPLRVVEPDEAVGAVGDALVESCLEDRYPPPLVVCGAGTGRRHWPPPLLLPGGVVAGCGCGYIAVMSDVADTPVLEFTSHIAGKNAKVRVYRDRIEWGRKDRMNAAGKAGLAMVTLGTSYLATGVTRKDASEMIPIRSISSITTKKGVLNTLVSIITTGNTIEMNVSHKEAAALKDLVQTLMLNQDAPVVTAAPAAPSAAEPDVAGELQKFAALRDQGVITAEDFEAKKRQLLGL